MFRRTALSFAFFAATLTARADDLGHCDKQLLPAPVHPSAGRKYARDRVVAIEHLKLDVTPDFTKRTIRATAELRFKPIAKPVTKIELDAVGLSIEKVEAKGAALAGYEVTDTKLVLTFKEPIAAGAEASVTITYHAQPENGLYFRTPEMGYKQGDTQVWSQGEPELHRYWFPCYDYPNERFTSEITCHVPDGMSVVSNGKLVEQKKDADGLTTWHWLQDKPHVNYLVALAAGFFHKIEEKAGDLPLAVFVPPSEKDQAANAFLDTKKIIEFYQRETGVPFAWDKYYQVYCLDFLAGGMENTSCTFQAASLLYTSESEQLRTLHPLDAHETAHQWFGDLVTCRDWAHLWLNEGFASYYTVLYEEQKNGHDAMLYALWREAQNVYSSLDTRPTVWRDYADAMDQFDYRVYPKGSWILHMIRSRLGPDLYRECIHDYLEKHRNGIATTDDLMNVFEEHSGLSFDQFADQWLYHGGLPELRVEYSWDAATKQARLNVKQTQKVSEQVLLFRFDLPVRVFVKGAPVDFKVTVSKAEEDFDFTLSDAPELLRVDPDYTVLMKLDFTPPPDMLKRQLKSDVIGRMLAAQILGGRKDTESVEMLTGLLNNDSFHAVRSEAAKALKKMNTPEARAALAKSLKQPDARVRREVVDALAAFPQADAQNILWEQAQTEKNPDILAAIIKTWGARPGDAKVSESLHLDLERKSYHNVIANAAIAAFRAQDDTGAVPAILKIMQDAPLDFGTYEFANAMNTIAFLARNEKHPQRNEVLALLTGKLSDPRPDLRTSAAKSLGTLHDPRAIALLEPLTKVTKPYSDPLRDAAEKSLQQLQSQLEGTAEMKGVWDKLQQLEKKSEEQEHELEKLRKKAEPQKPEAAAQATKKKAK